MLVLSGIKIVGVPQASAIILGGIIVAAIGFLVWSFRVLTARRPAPELS